MTLNCPKSIINVTHHNCPVCDNDDNKEINRSAIYNFSLNVCQNCGFIFRSDWMDKQSFVKYGKRFHRSMPNQGYFQKEIINSYVIDKLIDFEGTERVLFINSGLGYTASKLKCKSVTALELSEAHHLFSKYNYKIDSRNAIDCKDANYDVVVMIDYINYMIQPGSYLKAIREKLKDTGMLLISCPIIEQPAQDFLTSGMADQYSAFYTRKTLINLLESSGFKIDSEINYLKNPFFICTKSDPALKFINPEESESEIVRYMKVIDLTYKGDIEGIKRLNNRVHSCYFKFKFDTPEAIDHNKILEELSQANECMPNYVPIAGLIAQYYYTIKQYDKAIEIFNFITKYTCDSSVAELFSVCLYDAGIFDESLEWLKVSQELTAPSAKLIELMSAAIWAMREIESI